MRWTILSLLFAATTINYLDRAILGTLLPEIRKELTLSTETYGAITFWFQIAYGAGSLLGGIFLDRFGTRLGYGIAAALWSAAAMANSFASSALQFSLFRLILGLGESPNFPACNKAAAEWFPAQQRATAIGVVNFGTNFANIIGPPVLIGLSGVLGWKACFAIMGSVGFLWLPVWFWVYRKGQQPDFAPAREVLPLGLLDVLKYKQTWGYAWAKFLTDPVWWFYLFWLNPYLTDVRHFTPAQRATALSIVYTISGAGAILGGVVSSRLIKKGWDVGKARKTTMLACAIVMPVCACGVLARADWLAVALFGLSTAAHQAWMTNLFTAPGDVFPPHAVASANGVGVSMGALGGALFSGLIPGYVIPRLGYTPVLLTMGCFYLVAWLIVDKLLGNYEPVTLRDSLAIPGAAVTRPVSL